MKHFYIEGKLKFGNELKEIFQTKYQEIAFDLIEPEGRISREELFDIICDMTHNQIDGEVGDYWSALFRASKLEYTKTIFPFGYYEVGVAEEF